MQSFTRGRHSSYSLLAPRVAGFVDVGVGKDVVEEDVLGNLAAPGQLLAGLVGQGHVLQQEIPSQRFQIAIGHIGDQEGHPLALLGRGVRQRLDKFASVGVGTSQGLLYFRRPPGRLVLCARLSGGQTDNMPTAPRQLDDGFFTTFVSRLV